MEQETKTRQILRTGQFSALAGLCLGSGFLLTLDNLGILKGIWRLWPVFTLFLGIGGIWFFEKGERRDLKPLGMGCCLVLMSLFFFFLNYTSWSHMGKMWPTFIVIFGLSLLVVSYFADKKRWYAVSGLFFVFLAAVFFIVFTVNSELWPVSLMLFGIWLFLVPERNKSEKGCRNC